ncbi:MAG TPA: reverse transcriptase family protein [Bryobacteraceae bacterium]|nr:reverse transcriptase family protein [Bryobacteraceae bacterium]
MPRNAILSALARSFLAGQPGVDDVVARASQTLGRRPRWLKSLAQNYVETFAGRTRPRRRDVIDFLKRENGNLRIKRIRRWLTEPAQMQPVPAAAAWDVPAIESIGALTDWLRLNPGELEWLADLRGLGCKTNNSKLQHYYYRVLAKPSGGMRLIEAPKSCLKQIQRKVLAHILDKVPHHSAVHGFVRGRSIRTFVAPHTGQRVVLRMDLQDFFPSFTGARIQAVFRTAGYPEPVADLLGGICTNAVPRDICRGHALYMQPHLPQGSPTSPALANICSWRMDCRLAGLAKSAGAGYTRYADDLAFSGGADFERRVERFSTHVAAIVHEESVAVNHRKTRIMRRSVRQHLAGLVVNDRCNIKRADFDLLKAIVTNCARRGPGGENRANLAGRIAFVESINPARGQRLRRIFEQINWP